jgi:hypothetical protein
MIVPTYSQDVPKTTILSSISYSQIVPKQSWECFGNVLGPSQKLFILAHFSHNAMGWIFGKEDEKVAQLDIALKESFARVRQDTGTIYQWLRYLQQMQAQQQQLIEEQQHDLDDYEQIVGRHAQEISRQKQLIERLQAELRTVPKDSETIKRVIDAHYDFDAILGRIVELEAKIIRLEQTKHVSAPLLQQSRQEVALSPSPATPSRPALREKIVQRITRNSKEYLKSMILNLITKYGKISALQLREIVVEEQGLASKSSFYRFIEELEEEGAVSVVSTGKEKVLVVGSEVKKHAK